MSFAASEAYKLLRTKLQFSFADETHTCRVIGVSSAMTGEGKSLTAVNLAYSLSQLGRRVLLIDCDMRRPSICDKLPIHNDPGLSEFLSGQAQAENLIQFCGLEEDKSAFHVIASGRVPPNPMELLSSSRMAKSLTKLRNSYDYIILDLPPVGEVGDALAVAKYTDGLLMVVRQDYCNRLALSAALRQFEFVDTKILGVIFNAISEEGGGYGYRYGYGYRSRYYNRYYKRYYRKYYKAYNKKGSSYYAAAAKQKEKK
jgi:capsular exopolysaccharide synthesis family protein